MKRAGLLTGQELHIHSDRFSVYSGDFRLFTFFVETHVNTVDAADEDRSVRLEKCGENEFVWSASSSVWDKKEYRLKITGKSFVFSVKVSGKGSIGDIEYFRGSSESVGSDYCVAGYTLANCQDNNLTASTFQMNAEPAVLDSCRCAPPPFVYPFFNDYNGDVIGIGAAAPAGRQNYCRFELHAPSQGWSRNGCWFTLPMAGYTAVDGEWKTPFIWGGFAPDVNSVYTRYARWHYKYFGFEKNIPSREAPDWWKKPVFCGWGGQCSLRNSNPGFTAKDFADQKTYSSFTGRIDELQLPFGTVIIDDKWQTEYGTLSVDENKWPGLRAFADSQHEKGRHVLLWFKCWDREGIPDDECVTLDGEAVFADPTNPKYLDRLGKAVYTLLSADDGCCNCDGFKIDFMDCFPKCSGLKSYKSGVYGLEMMKCLFDSVYRFAKQAKPDALINMSSLHPYFAGNCDMFRIHDFGAELRNPISVMDYRISLAKACLEDILVDVDGFKGCNKNHQLKLMAYGAEKGVPAMYFFPEDFGEPEWNKLRECYTEYIAKL